MRGWRHEERPGNRAGVTRGGDEGKVRREGGREGEAPWQKNRYHLVLPNTKSYYYRIQSGPVECKYAPKCSLPQRHYDAGQEGEL